MSIEFLVCIGTLFFLAGIGTPIAYAIIIASLAYLFTGGEGIGIVGKVLMDGAVPKFHPACGASVYRGGEHHERGHD